jgi:hypothetical protein
MKTKIKDLDTDVEMLALDIIDYAVDEGKTPIHTVISSRDFLSNLISVLKIRDSPEVQTKILYLIKKWGLNFDSQKDILPGFSDTYRQLEKNNVTFPKSYTSVYKNYLGGDEKYNNFNNDFSSGNNNNNYGNIPISNNNYEDQVPTKLIKLDLNRYNYPGKFHRFMDDLEILIENLQLGNEIIDNTNPSEGVDEGLRTIVRNLKEQEKKLILAIQDLTNDKLMEISLGLNDDLNKVNLIINIRHMSDTIN